MGYEMTIPFASVEHLFAWKLETHLQANLGAHKEARIRQKKMAKKRQTAHRF